MTSRSFHRLTLSQSAKRTVKIAQQFTAGKATRLFEPAPIINGVREADG